MKGAKTLSEAPDPLRVSCYQCKLAKHWTRQELLNKGVGRNASLPDLLHGLSRLIKCERALSSEFEQKSKPCMLKYEGLNN